MSLFALYYSLAGVRVAGFSLLSLGALASAVLWDCCPLSILSASDLISAISRLCGYLYYSGSSACPMIQSNEPKRQCASGVINGDT